MCSSHVDIANTNSCVGVVPLVDITNTNSCVGVVPLVEITNTNSCVGVTNTNSCVGVVPLVTHFISMSCTDVRMTPTDSRNRLRNLSPTFTSLSPLFLPTPFTLKLKLICRGKINILVVIQPLRSARRSMGDRVVQWR